MTQHIAATIMFLTSPIKSYIIRAGGWDIFSGGLTLGGPTLKKKNVGGGLDDYLKRARCARLMLDA